MKFYLLAREDNLALHGLCAVARWCFTLTFMVLLLLILSLAKLHNSVRNQDKIKVCFGIEARNRHLLMNLSFFLRSYRGMSFFFCFRYPGNMLPLMKTQIFLYIPCIVAGTEKRVRRGNHSLLPTLCRPKSSGTCFCAWSRTLHTTHPLSLYTFLGTLLFAFLVFLLFFL